MGLPPTSSKISTDLSEVTTFKFDFPNFTGTHTGTDLSLGINSVAGGGTGDSTLTTNNFLVGAGTSPVTFFAPGASGTVVSSNGTNFINTNFAGTAAFAAFYSSTVTTESTLLTSATFVTFSNSPAFTFTPTVSGTYVIYASIPVGQAADVAIGVTRIFNTSGGATLLQENQGSAYGSGGTIVEASTYTESFYTLTAGTEYVFDIQGEDISGSEAGIYCRGDLSNFAMVALGIGLTSPAVATPHSIRYYSSTSSISSSLGLVTYATKDYDVDSAYSSGIYTVQSGGDGKYQVNATLLVTGTISLNDTLILELWKNGSVISRTTNYLFATETDAKIQLSDIINCAATDTLQIQASISSTGPSIVSSNFDNYLSICRISA